MPEVSMRVEVEKRGTPGNPMGALEAEIRVISIEGGEDLLDGKPFVFQREVSSSSHDAPSRFYSVATVHQMSVLPAKEPDSLQTQDEPFWRSSSTGVISFSSPSERDWFVSSTLESLSDLQTAAREVLEGGSSIEEFEISAAPLPPLITSLTINSLSGSSD